jgi:hypothetical protein
MLVEWAVLVVFSDQFIREYSRFGFPGVVAVGIALPFDQILELPASTLEPVIDDGLHFVLFFASDQVGWRSVEIWPVSGSFAIGR